MTSRTQRVSTLLAAAGLALLAGSGAAYADNPLSDVVKYLTTAPTPAPETANPNAQLYPTYNSNANLGQGSGNSGAIGR